MNIALWIVQGLLGALFLFSGTVKAFQSIDKLAEKMPWVLNVPVPVVRFIGVTQLLAAIGLVLPWLTGIEPILTPIAATGLCLTMVFAIVYHTRQNEFLKALPINGMLFLLAAFVAYGRFMQ